MSYSNAAGQTGTGGSRTKELQEANADGAGLSFTGRIAGWSARHRWWVIAASVLVIFLAMFALNTVEMKVLDYNGEGESVRGRDLIDERFDVAVPPTEQLVFSNPSLGMDDPIFRSTVEGLVQQLRALPEVVSVASYYDTNSPNMVSDDGSVLLAQVVIEGDADDAEDKIDAILDTVYAAGEDADGFEIVMAGDTPLVKQVEDIDNEDFSNMIVVTMVLALVLMLIAFRSVVAAAIPLVLPLGSIFTALN